MYRESEAVNGIHYDFWNEPIRDSPGYFEHPQYWSFYSDKILLPKGSIKKLIGRELSWSDEAVELK